MDATQTTITPELASQMMQNNTRNRPLRKSTVKSYAKEMKAGRWKLTHQGIAFNCDGTLLDGQHRLAAIIECGVPQVMMVFRGIESEAQIVMDDHSKRSAGDALSLDRGQRITNKEIAVIRAAVELPSNRSQKLSKQDLNDVFDRIKPAIDFVFDSQVKKNQRGVTSAAVLGAIALSYFYVEDLGRLSKFREILFGKEIPEHEGDRAALTLREWCLTNGVRYSSERKEAFKKTQRAIVAFFDRQNVKKLYGTSFYFAWPLVDPKR